MPYKAAFKEFTEKIRDKQRVQILCHGDSDGLCAAVIMYKSLQKIGLSPLDIIYPEKGENIYCSDSFAGPVTTGEKLKQISPDALIVLDLGLNEDIIPGDIPVLFIDHHFNYFPPKKSIRINSYPDKNVRPTSLLTYDLCHGICDVKDLGWLAAVGTTGDLGHDNPFNIIREIIKDCSMTDIKEVSVLINSAKRSSEYDIAAALRALMQADSPKQILEKELPEVDLLKNYRNEVNREWRKMRHIAPRFMWKVALVAFSSACDIGGLLASMWAHQLQSYIVITVNFGYVEGKAEFIIKTKTKINVMKFMESVKPKEITEPIAFGHDSAAGGIVDIDAWRKITMNMGYKD